MYGLVMGLKLTWRGGLAKGLNKLTQRGSHVMGFKLIQKGALLRE